MAVTKLLGWVSEWLNVVRIEGEIIVVGNLHCETTLVRKRKISPKTHLLKVLDQVRMLVRYVLFHKRSRFEQFLTGLAPEFAFILLFNIRLSGFGEFPRRQLVLFPSGMTANGLVIMFSAIVTRIDTVAIKKQSNL